MPDSDLQYFPVDPTPEPAPRFPWQKLVLFVVVVAVVIALVVFGVNIWRRSRDASIGLSNEAQNTLSGRLEACASSRDQENCEARVRSETAKEEGSAEACAGLTNSSLESCVTLAAKTSGEPADCATLVDEAKTTCEDLARFTHATTVRDIRECAQIVNTMLAVSCRSRVTDAAVAFGDCEAAHVDQALCDTGAALREAIASGSPEACAALGTDDLRYQCDAGINSLDGDGDGLVIADEYAAGTSDDAADSDGDGLDDGEEVNDYGTNPASADTDGDGYNDKTEVQSGHDPLNQ